MAKMFYTTDEAAQKLNVTPDQLKQLVSSNKLREFRDGAKVMFKVDQVDKLSSDKGSTKSGSSMGGSSLGDSGIALADSHASDVISLADSTASTAKDDTVVTGSINVLETGEHKSPADTAAQTKIQSAIDDQLSLEGVGSGSGLLDLTRESDDTSLGAELLDEIYPGGESKGDSSIASASGIFEQAGSPSGDSSGPSGLENIAASTTPMASAPVYETDDPSAAAFGGMALAAVLTMVVTGIIAVSFFQGFTPGWAQTIYESSTNILIFGAALLVISALFAGVGFFVGKSTAR